MDTNVKGLYFIAVPPEMDPAELVHRALTDLKQTRVARSRCVLCLVSVGQCVCLCI